MAKLLKKIILASVFMLTIPITVFGSDTDGVQKFVMEKYPGKEASVYGPNTDINGQNEYFVILKWKSSEDAGALDYDSKIAIVVMNNNKYEIYTESLPSYAYRIFEEEIKFRNKIVIYSYSFSNGCCYRSGYSFKFRKDSNGVYQIIGFDGHSETTDLDEFNQKTGEYKSTEKGKSVNLSTSEVMEWSTESGKRIEKRKIENSINPIPFNGFNFENFMDL